MLVWWNAGAGSAVVTRAFATGACHKDSTSSWLRIAVRHPATHTHARASARALANTGSNRNGERITCAHRTNSAQALSPTP